ncbi:SAM and U-box domain-containing protein 1 [Seminavis robusta]|uniref:SAM and U-box domain-containing protein 1 n=1 Tax=Seminavis robusta TaxID=568900 RepID=A0A9N8EIK4_9STRA|nr:SAM and U-box domain-containing protein 1 [Seminavis robusta]|eukprot:Sro992_g228790.1 SAM and U-box domain-containing protein 1 (288) ;mRNA; f:6955-7818
MIQMNGTPPSGAASAAFDRNDCRRPPLLCPLTMEPLVDPVVSPDGESYEKSVVVCDEEAGLYYPNRALKEYIQAVPTMHSSGSEPPADSTTDDDIPPILSILDLFVCPITEQLLRDPVIDRDGNTFERRALVKWIKEEGTSPITRRPLMVQQLYDNTTLLLVLTQEVHLHIQNETEPRSEELRQWITDRSEQPSGSESEEEPEPPQPPEPEPEPPRPPEPLSTEQRRVHRNCALTIAVIYLCLVLVVVGTFALNPYVAIAFFLMTCFLVPRFIMETGLALGHTLPPT